MHACAVEIKLNTACFIDVRVWMRILLALQNGDFHRKNGVIQYCLFPRATRGNTVRSFSHLDRSTLVDEYTLGIATPALE